MRLKLFVFRETKEPVKCILPKSLINYLLSIKYIMLYLCRSIVKGEKSFNAWPSESFQTIFAIMKVDIYKGKLYTVVQNKPDTIKSVIISWCFIGPKILYYGFIKMTVGILIMHNSSFWACILWLICLHICSLAEYQIHTPKNPEMW